MLSTFLILVLFCYVLLILSMISGFLRVKKEPEKFSKPKNQFSIIIPFRNEVAYLPILLYSISKLNYDFSLFEVLLIDDDSTDSSVELIKSFKAENPQLQIQTLNNQRCSNSPKKDALATGIQQAKNNWILTTDADCKLPPNWLNTYNSKIGANPHLKFIAGPVTFWKSDQKWLSAFQQIDFLSLQGATIGSFGLDKAFMCNGANLGFDKAEYINLQGYENINHIASGDDVFLMQKFVKVDPKQVSYLKARNALVYTAPQESLHNLLQQRKRWAAKASAYTGWFAILTSILVFLGNASVFVGLFFAKIWPVILLKVAVDFVLIYLTATLFAQKYPLKHYLWIALVYPIFTVYIALASQFGTYKWKGRNFKK